MNKEYYVYGYIRLDTNTYFYIGKVRVKDIKNYIQEELNILKIL